MPTFLHSSADLALNHLEVPLKTSSGGQAARMATLALSALTLVTAMLSMLAQPIAAQTSYRLWQGQAPGAKGNGGNDTPTLTIYKPSESTANGAAFLMVPGGGYGTVVLSEADAARQFWIPKGFVIAVLKYRISPYQYPIPMYDVKRAMRMLRSKAGELGVDTNRVGILGCSAGGHLASYLATHYDMGDANATDSIERFKTKPDFSVFVYPVITMDASFTHAGSRSALLGNNPSAALVDSLSNEKQVTPQTPPTFLVHGTVDNVVQVKNSQVFFDACQAKQVPVKFYKITDNCASHGFGYNCDNWGQDGYNWLKTSGYLDVTGPVGLTSPRLRHSPTVRSITNRSSEINAGELRQKEYRNVSGRAFGDYLASPVFLAPFQTKE